MTWRSTAIVSGVGLLATWFAAVPPARVPAATVTAPVPAAARPAAAPSDIVAQAAHLQMKLHPQNNGYQQPARNPFQFAARKAVVTIQPPAPVTPVALPVAPTISITLSGIAADAVGGKQQRTAILRTPAGLVLAQEGEEVGGQFRVGMIGEEAVDLIRLDDGSIVRISLKP